MLIKTNSKCDFPDRLVNADLCMSIGVTGSEVLAEKANGKIIQIGVYETPERAKAALDDIFMAFGNCETFIMADANIDQEQVMFLDGLCVKCGHDAGNGGIYGESLRCGICGWVQPAADTEIMYKEIDAIIKGLKE